MIPSLPDIMAQASHRTFGRTWLDIDCIGIVVDAMIEWALGPDWSNARRGLFTEWFRRVDGTLLGAQTYTALNDRGMRRVNPTRWAKNIDPGPAGAPQAVRITTNSDTFERRRSLNIKIYDFRRIGRPTKYVLVAPRQLSQA